MYSTCFFIISAVLFILQAIPSTTSRGISIPLIKRETSSLDELANGIERSVAKLRRGMAIFQMNTDDNTSAKREVFFTPMEHTTLIFPDHILGDYHFVFKIGQDEYKVALDGTSGNIILPSSECTGPNCDGHTKYTPLDGQPSSGTFELKYIGYTITVKGYAETFVLPGTEEEIEAPDQIFGAATSYPPDLKFRMFEPDGIIGVGPPILTMIGARPFLVTLAHENPDLLPGPLLCLRLGKTANEQWAYFGAPDPRIRSEIAWIEYPRRQRYWELNLEKIEMNGFVFRINGKAILDFLQPMIIGDESTIMRIIKRIPDCRIKNHQNGFAYAPCDSQVEFKFTVNQREMVMSFRDLVVGHVPRSEGFENFCILGVGVDKGLPRGSWLLGYAFLQGFYALLDFNPQLPRFGFVRVPQAA